MKTNDIYYSIIEVYVEMIIDFFFKRHSIRELIDKFIYEYRICMIIFIIGMLAKYWYKIPTINEIDVIHNIADRINDITAYIVSVEDNILTAIFQVIENIIH